jgi:hypothetical protein
MTHTTLLERIRSEYLEMPGLAVTFVQAQRLFGLEWTLCKMVFDALVDQQFLRLSERGTYVRASDGGVLPVASSKTRLLPEPDHALVS